MAEKDEASSNDLPLSANLEDITVKHFTLDLTCHLGRQVFEGSITLWCLATHAQRPEKHQQSTGKDSGTASCATDSVDGNEQLPSAVASQPFHGMAGQTARGWGEGREEGSSDQYLEASCQDHCGGKDHTVSLASCIQSYPSTGRCSKMDFETDGQLSQVCQTREPIDRVMKHASLDRNFSFGWEPSHALAAGDSRAAHSLEKSQMSSKEQIEKRMCRVENGLSLSSTSCTKENDLSVIFQSSSSLDPDKAVVYEACCFELPRESISVTNSTTVGVPDCLDPGDAGDIVTVQQMAVYSSVSQNSSFISHKCDSQITDMVRCLKSDCKHDIAEISNMLHCPRQTKEDHQADFSPKCKHDYAMINVPSWEMIGSHQPCFSRSCSSSFCRDDQVCAQNQTTPEPFRMVLDTYKLHIQRVEGVYLQGADRLLFEQHPDKFLKQINKADSSPVLSEQTHHCPMQFVVKEHCVDVFVEDVHCPRKFPHAVQIWYSTDPLGPSLKWTKDQDDNDCVFTVGHFLSNRSLFPSQDFPTALLTWHASVTVDIGLTVVLTGDYDPYVTDTDDGRKRFSYFTQFPMPSSTFAIAVGNWQMERLQYRPSVDDVAYLKLSRPAIHLFFPSLLREKSLSVLGDYLPHCMLEVQDMLGVYPFHRLDVVVVPACFDSLGMASPSLLFLSQSVLCYDGSMCIRVAHELCHTWFGLVIGPGDWTEEWMTEGFCTYLEDILHARVTQLGELTEDFLGLRAELHLQVLKAEIDNTDENLQCLRPNQGKGDPASSGEETRYLRNGLNVEKKFMQVHYLKGYFLLCALEREAGREQFLSFLKAYVQRYLCQLVTSQEFLQMFFSSFPNIIHMSLDSINSDWLDCPGMPKRLAGSVDGSRGDGDKENALTTQVRQQLVTIVKMCRRRPERKRGHRGQLCQQLSELKQMQTTQVVMLLEGLLNEKRVPGHVLDLVRASCHHHLDNPEVCHRWCELVIKHRHKKWYSDVQSFLIHHQAMGVYLYGEASISRNPDVVQLARSCFRQIQHDMPENVCNTVSAMLYGT